MCLEGAEQTIFSLNPRHQPSEILAVTARISANSGSDAVNRIHGGIDKIVDQCWGIGAALYFHCTWRWRVSFFDPHNDVSTAHHEAGFSTRLTRGHASITADELRHPTDRVIGQLRSVIWGHMGRCSTRAQRGELGLSGFSRGGSVCTYGDPCWRHTNCPGGGRGGYFPSAVSGRSAVQRYA
jgi:hypothetical protein